MPRDISEGRWSNPFAKRALEEARAVNPSYADIIEPIGWAEYDPSASTLDDYIPEYDSVLWQLLGSIPGGETAGLAARRNLGFRDPPSTATYDPPPTYAHAASRDAVNLATLPLGFLRALSLGIPADLAGDVAASLATGRWPDSEPVPHRGTVGGPAPRAAKEMTGWEEYKPPSPRPSYRYYGMR